MNSKYCAINTKIDHIAIAVRNLEDAILFYRDILGFKLLFRREVDGAFSGMRSAEFEVGSFYIVLVEGTTPESQVCRYIEEYGPGVQHIAISVSDVALLASSLKDLGISFCTDVIEGDGIVQIFTSRDGNSGMMFEFIQRVTNSKVFDPASVQKLYEQLEAKSAY